MTTFPAFAGQGETSSSISRGSAALAVHRPLPALSDIPIMQEQGKRMAALMEKIQEITDPAERKRMLAEAVCPQ